MVPQHGQFSLHTMLEGPWLHKRAFPTPIVQPLEECQGSSPLRGHGSWLMCEVALNVKTGVLCIQVSILENVSQFKCKMTMLWLCMGYFNPSWTRCEFSSWVSGVYYTLRAASAQNNSKNRCQNFGILLAFFAEYNINYFSKLPKSKKFLLLTRILLTA